MKKVGNSAVRRAFDDMYLKNRNIIFEKIGEKGISNGTPEQLLRVPM